MRALVGVELRMLARDRRTLFASVILPILVLPLFFLSQSVSERKREERLEAQTFDYRVTGPHAEEVRAALARAPGESGGEGPEIRLRELVEGAAERAGLEAQDFHVLVETVAAEDRDPPEEDEDPPPPVPLARLVFLADWDASQTALGELEERLVRGRAQGRADRLLEAGLELDLESLAEVTERIDVSTAGEKTGAALGRSAATFLTVLLLIGGSVVAADTLAGERERGTLETLLTTAASRGEIVTAKLLGILAVGLLIALVQVLNLLVYVKLELLELPADFVIDLSAAAFFWLPLLFAPLAALVAASMLWVSGRSATYKAFQTNFLPLTLLFMLPAAVPLLPGLQLRSAIVAVPVSNVAVAIREVLAGRFDVPMLGLCFLFASATAAWAARAVLRDLDSERLVLGASSDNADLAGGPGVFPRRVLLWFAAMWAINFLAASNVPGLSGMRAQVLFNIVLVMFGGSLVMIRVYGLDLRETLKLSAPKKPRVWLAVLLGAPSTFVVMVGIGRLSSWLFPVPESVVEAFSQLVPDVLPLWQLLFFVAVVPGIFEEIAFRGVLQHGLRRKFPPVALCLVVGAVFAVFHMQWVRLLPTFFLGTLLSALTLLSGSLLPAMVWHAINNASAIVATRLGIDLTALGLEVYAAAAVASALAWTLLWRSRDQPTSPSHPSRDRPPQ